MWRDIERRAARLGLTPNLPAPYPSPKSDKANQIAYLALQQPWGHDYIRASYSLWFENGIMPGEYENYSQCLESVSQHPDKFVDEEKLQGANEVLLLETATASDLGIFGSPSFVVGEELFWGDDRLEDAVSFAINANRQR